MRDVAYIDDAGRLHDGAVSFVVARNLERWQVWLGAGRPFRLMGLHQGGYLVPLLTARPKRLVRGGMYWYGYAYVVRRQRSVYLGTSDAVTPERLQWAAGVLAHV